MKTAQISFLILALGLILASTQLGCGGGGGNGDDSSGVVDGGTNGGTTPSADLTIITDARLYAESDLATNQFTIYWTDTLIEEIGYRVEMTSGGISSPSRLTWTEAAFLPPTSGTGFQYSWTTDIVGDKFYRVIAVSPAENFLLATQHGATSVRMNSSLSAEVVVSGTDPRSGVLTIQVDATGFIPLSVDYFLDLMFIGSGGADANKTLEWDSEGTQDGSHLMLARVEYEDSSYLIARTSFVLDNIPEIQLSIKLCAHVPLYISYAHGFTSQRFCGDPWPATWSPPSYGAYAPPNAAEYFRGGRVGGALMDVNLYGSPGPPTAGSVSVESVELFIDGVSYGAIDDVPPLSHRTTNNLGTWEWDVLSETHGNHELRAVALLSDGRVEEITRTVFVDNFPNLELQEPLPGAIVGNTLVFSGSFSDDAPGTEIVIKIGDLEIFRTSYSPFYTTFEMTGLPYGAYEAELSITDSGGHFFKRKPIIYFQERPEDFTRVTTIQISGLCWECGLLYDIENGEAIFSLASNVIQSFGSSGQRYVGDLIFHDEVGREIIITPITIDGPSFSYKGFDLSHGRIAMEGGGYDYGDVFYWDGASIINISETIEPLNLQCENKPKLKWPWIMWYAGTGTFMCQEHQYYVLSNLETGERHQIAPLDTARITESFDFDFEGSELTAVFCAGENVYLFSSTNEIVRQIGEGSGCSQCQVEGGTVIWHAGNELKELKLVEATPFATPVTLSTNVSYNSGKLRDGLVAWTEGRGASGYGQTTDLFVYDGVTTIQIGTNLRHWGEHGSSHPMFEVGGGTVIWQNVDGNIYLFNRERCTNTLIFSIPDNPYRLQSLRIDNNYAYLLLLGEEIDTSVEKSLYKMMFP
ncbi:MAG: hypothetical protein JRG73_13670 [Deltaproteobacteria bacterium]|nr:hypothetical protein [Deltaproteobacteria bacterium]